MNWDVISTLVWRDLRIVVRSKAVMIPLVMLPLILLVLLPGIGGAVLANLDPEAAAITDMRTDLDLFFENLPASIADEVAGYDPVQEVIYLTFAYFFAPLFLIVPVMVANVIAADSFVGEKERKTLEALLYTPTTDRELYIAKLLAPWVAAVAVTVGGALLYAVIINVVAWPAMGEVFLPNLSWVLLVLWVSPAASGLGLTAMVLVSARVNTFQEATQLGGVVILPILLLVFGQVGGVLYFSPLVTVGLGLVLWVIVGGMVWFGTRTFTRGALLSQGGV